MATSRYFMPTHIKFGIGALSSLKEILKSEDRVYLVTDPGLEKLGMADKVRAIIDETGAACHTYNDIVPNPTADLVNEAMNDLKSFAPTTIVALGGGSPTDVGKIMAALATNDRPLEDYQWNGVPFENPSLPFIAIPTTSGTGSEVTRVAVIIDRKLKKGINSDVLFPKYAIIDPELMTGLPRYLTATTGVDALTHAIEAYVGLNSNPFTDSYAEEAIRLIGKSLWRACANGNDIEARKDMAIASCLAGAAMDQGGLGMVHAMSSPLCAYFNMAHGESNSVLLERVMEYNLMAKPEKFAKIAELLGCQLDGLDLFEKAEMSVMAVHRLFEQTGAVVDLKKFGVSSKDADLIAEETNRMFMIRNNPRKSTDADCKQVFLNILSDYGIE
ncbi:MAG: iron-containing alcohol dehydrogenase [Clostridiales bacterium]|nr:iron-containing alcohol dehydrogenase [Clostridiales bacterium]